MKRPITGSPAGNLAGEQVWANRAPACSAEDRSAVAVRRVDRLASAWLVPGQVVPGSPEPDRNRVFCRGQLQTLQASRD
jgi:hypothetical protein